MGYYCPRGLLRSPGQHAPQIHPREMDFQDARDQRGKRRWKELIPHQDLR